MNVNEEIEVFVKIQKKFGGGGIKIGRGHKNCFI